jgi:hypothetical protein
MSRRKSSSTNAGAPSPDVVGERTAWPLPTVATEQSCTTKPANTRGSSAEIRLAGARTQPSGRCWSCTDTCGSPKTTARPPSRARPDPCGTYAYDLGFSDIATVFVNGRPIFRGDGELFGRQAAARGPSVDTTRHDFICRSSPATTPIDSGQRRLRWVRPWPLSAHKV